MVMGSLRQETDVVVIGAGPGGYVAALRLADLGKDVVLVEERERPGGTCLLEGCIPSKALIHAVELKHSAHNATAMGFDFGEPKLNLDTLRSWTNDIVAGLSSGVSSLLKRRGVEVLHGHARFTSSNSIDIEGGDVGGIDFKKAIIATGSRINELPAAYEKPVWSSAEALALPYVPSSLLVVGGGYIGLEMGLVYAGLGSQVSVVEFFPRLLVGADEDLVDIMLKQVKPRLHEIMVDSKVVGVDKSGDGFTVTIEHDGNTLTQRYQQVLVAVGRRPNTDHIGVEHTSVKTDAQGFIITDVTGRTADANIFAIGDVTHGPMLAHKASREAKVVADTIAHGKSAFDNRSIPAVVFTDPEIAWAGLTENEAKAEKVDYEVGKFPLAALGRARTLGRPDGVVKILFDPDSKTVLGVGMVGAGVSELIAEGSLAIEMGATLEDLVVTIHPHPTMSEALMEAAEVALGEAVHVNPPRKKSVS